MANVLVEETSLQNIANSIREKTGTEDTYKPSEMATAISGIETGGGTPEKGIVINEWDSDGYATDVSIVGYTEIPYYMFYGMFTQNGTGTYYPNIFGKATKVTLPSELTQIREGAFMYCENLPITELPSGVTSIGQKAFYYCYELALTELPSGITSIGDQAFYDCRKLKIKEVPSCLTNVQSQFYSCQEIEELTFNGAVTYFKNYALKNCSKLAKLVLPNVTKVPTLGGTDVFYDTPIASGTGYIYVPDTLVDSFKSATNWSTYADQIKPISEMPTE